MSNYANCRAKGGIAEQALSKLDLERVDRRWRSDGSDRFVADHAVRFKWLVERPRWRQRKLQTA